MAQRRRGLVSRRFSAWLARLRRGQDGGGLSGGALPADNEDPDASRAQGGGDGSSGDGIGSIEPAAPASGSGFVAGLPSSPGGRLLPSSGMDEGVMGEAREVSVDAHTGPNSRRADPDIPPSEVGASPPTRVGSITQGRSSDGDGARGYYPRPSPMAPPTFGAGELPLERSSSGSQFLGEGIHPGGAREFSSLGSGESYLNEAARVNPLLSIDDGVEPPEGAIPLEESNLPAFIDGSPDSQGVQEGLGATEPARTTAVAMAEVSRIDEPIPGPSRAEASRLVHPELRNFVDHSNQFPRPRQARPRSAGGYRGERVSIDSVLARADGVSSTSNLPIPLRSEWQAPPRVFEGGPYPPNPNRFRNPAGPIYGHEQGELPIPQMRQGSQPGPGRAPPHGGRAVWAPSTRPPPSSMSRSHRRPAGSHVPMDTVNPHSGSQPFVGTRGPTPTGSPTPGLFGEQSSRLRPPTPADLRSAPTLLSRTPPPSSQMARGSSFGRPRQPPPSMGSEWSNVGPSGSGISPFSAPSPLLPGAYTPPRIQSRPLGAPPTRPGGMHATPPTDFRSSMARPTWSANIRPPPNTGRGGHHSAPAPVRGYPPTQGVHAPPIILPLRENAPPSGNPPALPPRMNVIPQRAPTGQETAPPQVGASATQGGSLPQVVPSPHMQLSAPPEREPSPPPPRLPSPPPPQLPSPPPPRLPSPPPPQLPSPPPPQLPSPPPPQLPSPPPPQLPSPPPLVQGAAKGKKSKGWRHAVEKKVDKFFKKSPGGEGPAA